MEGKFISGRLNIELLERCAEFGSRALRLVEKLDKERKPRRIVDQLAGASVGGLAHLFEASEALSERDFIKTLGIAAKELSESLYWLNLVDKANWLGEQQLDELITENQELLRITKSMIARTKASLRRS